MFVTLLLCMGQGEAIGLSYVISTEQGCERPDRRVHRISAAIRVVARGEHDDLVDAVALGCWRVRKIYPEGAGKRLGKRQQRLHRDRVPALAPPCVGIQSALPA